MAEGQVRQAKGGRPRILASDRECRRPLRRSAHSWLAIGEVNETSFKIAVIGGIQANGCVLALIQFVQLPFSPLLAIDTPCVRE